MQTSRVKYMDQLQLRLQIKNYFASLMGKGKIVAREVQQGDALKFTACLKAVGLLRVNWFGSRKKIISYNYGTVFAVSPNIVITCLHNIYSQRLQRICDEAIFIPDINVEYVRDELKRYRVTKMEFIQYKLNSKKLFEVPVKEELVLMHLQEGVQLDFFLKIGLLPNRPQYKDNESLVIIGYPSSDLKEAKILIQACPKREIRRGKLHSIDNNIINYTINTEVGLSGSPVLCYNQMREYVVVGIHTHRGREKEYNSGLFFSREVLQCLSDYEMNIYRYLREQKRMGTDIMQIGIYFYLFFKNQRYRQIYTILPPDAHEYERRIEDEYYNFAQQQTSVERDTQQLDLMIEQMMGGEEYLVQIERRSSSVSDDANEAYLGISYQADLYDSIYVMSDQEGSQNPQQPGQYCKTAKLV